MTQAECLKILEKNPEKWFTSKEFCQVLKKTISSVADNLRKLYNQGVVFRKTERIHGTKIYSYKIR